jgi:succinoglycan biosynthesis protein ExoA
VNSLRKVSVIVPCRNENRHIAAFLDSVLAQDAEGLDIEILVVDGASDDGTRQTLDECSRRHPRVGVLDNPGRIVSTGLNIGIRAARGDIIVRMDCHSEFAADYIRTSVELLETTGASNVGGPARTKPRGRTGRAVAAAYHSAFSTGGARFHDEAYEGWVDTVTYGCWRKKTLVELGMFDEALVRNQDDEMNLRTIRAGGRIWQSPRIVSWYHPRDTLTGLFRQYFQYGFWKVPVIRKHRLPASARHLVPGLFILGNCLLGVAAAAALALGWREAVAWLLGIWAPLIGAYVGVSLAASFQAARRHGWDLIPLLPVVFAVYHASYGIGFLAGMWHWSRGGPESARVGRAFTELSR